MKAELKRSHAPIFWSLFGAGGMLSALIGPALVFFTGIAAPLGLFYPRDVLSWANTQAFAQHWAGKGFLFAVVALFLWHAAHRIFHSLHDLGVHAGVFAKLACYGLAMAGSLLAAGVLLSLGF